MARYFHTAKFLQRTPNAMIQEYLLSQGIDNDLTWQGRDERDTDDIYTLVAGLDSHENTRIKFNLERVHDLACPSAIKRVYQACNIFNRSDIIEGLDQLQSDHGRAMWLFLNHEKVFELATQLNKERFGSWKYCVLGTQNKLNCDNTSVNAFKESLKSFYKLQGDARYCKIDLYTCGQAHYFFTYPEGKAEIIPQYGNSEKEIKNLTIQKLHEVIFIYNSESGILKTNAIGTKEYIMSLQEQFCTCLLGMDTLPRQDNTIFDLNILKEPGFEFPLDDDETNVEGIKLKEVRFVLNVDTRNRILVTLDSNSLWQSYSRILESAGAVNNKKVAEAEIDYAKIQFIMRKPPKGRRPTLTFKITAPADCTLQDGEIDRIARKYLQKWKIMKQLEFGDDNLELAATTEYLEVPG